MIQDLEDIGFFHLAELASKKSTHPKYKVGCVIVVSGRVMSLGWNQNKTHPRHANPQNSFRRTIHAEVNAIMSASDISGGIVYVYRELKNGRPALARPCNYCYKLLEEKGVKRIYYTVRSSPYWREETL